MGTISHRIEWKVTTIHEFRQSLVDRPQVTVKLRIGLRVVAVSVEHEEVVPGGVAEDLKIVGDDDCMREEVPLSMNWESAPSCQPASEYWKDDPAGTKWYWLSCMITCCDCEGENSSFKVGRPVVGGNMARRTRIMETGNIFRRLLLTL
jgi:hypothetical protein